MNGVENVWRTDESSLAIRCDGKGVGSGLRRVGFCGEAVVTKKVLHLLLRGALMPTQRAKHREATGTQ
jgi:hypothetical protein